jgi:biotin transport system permease protein
VNAHTTLGLYRPGRTPIHRLAAGWKVLAVFGGGTLVMLTRHPLALAAAGVCVGLLYGVARIPWRVALAQARPAAPVLVVLGVAQWVTAGPVVAAVVLVRLATLIMLATLVTLTTRVSDMSAAIGTALRPLRWIGLPTDKVALAISMTLRFVPLLTRVVHEVHEAQRARGLERNLLALAVPVVVRALHTAEQVADAIDARSHGALEP